MKQILIILVASLFTSESIAQTKIVPLRTKGKVESGTYYKDLNNELLPYVGTWEGKVNGNTFKIVLERVKEYRSLYNFEYWKDSIVPTYYEMRDTKGKVLYHMQGEPKLRSFGFLKKGTLVRLSFLDTCIKGYVDLKFVDSSYQQLEWEYLPQGVIIAVVQGRPPKYDCAKFNEMPQEKFILTKL